MIDVKIIRKSKAVPTASGISTAITNYGDGTAKEAQHAAKADLATKAEYADKAGVSNKLDPDSPDWEKINLKFQDLSKLFLSKTSDDTAAGIITFLQGLVSQGLIKANEGVEFGEYVTGMFGSGAYISRQGYGEMRRLRVWEWLEVPEIRMNKITVNVGLSIESYGGGIIETVTPDPSGVLAGWATLKLEDGEYGAIAVGDLCMGLWHNLDGGNAEENTDDLQGNYQMRGFSTVYFRITDIPETDIDGNSNHDQHFFRYALREEGGNGIHPFAMMHFAQRGNPDNTDRQHIRYRTPKYTISMNKLDDWTFRPENIYDIEGELDGFTLNVVGHDGKIYERSFKGRGHVLCNCYIYGEVSQFEIAGHYMTIEQSSGGWMYPDEVNVVTCTIYDGYGRDVTSRYKRYSISRESGNVNDDNAWNALHQNIEITESPISFTLVFSDLGLNGVDKISTLFRVTATDGNGDDISTTITFD